MDIGIKPRREEVARSLPLRKLKEKHNNLTLHILLQDNLIYLSSVGYGKVKRYLSLRYLHEKHHFYLCQPR
ncbi:hypothetical protein [Candidatus Pantoea persica]|uniref:hypothetical protein n=1 Tax=Candidatus Pantoea persica TaxID=2518128 RepID=UPI00215D90F1|nr:hypothetical protein [Candidatus Pantoea persica]